MMPCLRSRAAARLHLIANDMRVQDGTQKSQKVFVNIPTEVGATEAEEIGTSPAEASVNCAQSCGSSFFLASCTHTRFRSPFPIVCTVLLFQYTCSVGCCVCGR